jgi:excinuclease ABC subunit C
VTAIGRRWDLGVVSTVRQRASLLPCAPGVYRFRDAAGAMLYVGRATQLRSRVASYWADLQDRGHLAPMVARIARIQAVVCASVHEAAWLERNLLEHHLPRWNRTPGGQESPVYIQLDARPAKPGLRVVYEVRPADGVQHFGPYLGGSRVRHAIGGLDRVLPLAYAATRLSGSAREMARRRGVGAADRTRLVAALTAILGQDPTAVSAAQADLLSLRDRATERQAFELASLIHDQIQAVDWISGTQRVTQIDPDGCDIYGWADGHLVRFEVRDGRVRTWTQRPCGRERAKRYLDTTPAHWIPFAQENAELAARLAGPAPAVRAGTRRGRDSEG